MSVLVIDVLGSVYKQPGKRAVRVWQVPLCTGPSGPPGESGPLLFLAYPHFCWAEPSLAHNVTGLQCDPERHTLFLDVEPITGGC